MERTPGGRKNSKLGPLAAIALGAAALFGGGSDAAAKEHPVPSAETLATHPQFDSDFVRGFYRRLRDAGYDWERLKRPEDLAYKRSILGAQEMLGPDISSDIDARADALRSEVRTFKQFQAMHASHRAFVASVSDQIPERSADPAVAAQEQDIETRASELLSQIYRKGNALFAEYSNLDTLARDMIASQDFGRVSLVHDINDLFDAFYHLCSEVSGTASGADHQAACDRVLRDQLDQEKHMDDDRGSMWFLPAHQI